MKKRKCRTFTVVSVRLCLRLFRYRARPLFRSPCCSIIWGGALNGCSGSGVIIVRSYFIRSFVLRSFSDIFSRSLGQCTLSADFLWVQIVTFLIPIPIRFGFGFGFVSTFVLVMLFSFFLPLAFRFRCIPACGNVSRPSWRMRNAAAQLHFLPHFARILRNVHSRARRSDRQRITVTGTFWEHRLGFGMCALAVVVRWNSCWYAALIGSPRALSFINTISQPDLKNRATCAMSTISVECPYLGIKFTTHYQRKKKKQKKLGRKKRKKNSRNTTEPNGV